MTRVRPLAGLGALAALALLAASAWAVTPGVEHARQPQDLGLAAEAVSFPAADSVAVSGWWFHGMRDTAVIVMAPRGTGTMADLLPAAKEFLARGFGVLTFDYRGFGPATPGRAGADPAALDSLRYIVYASAWVDDMLGALRYARAHTRRHVFAWGQDLGSAVAVAAAARERRSCDAVAVEGLFRSSQDVLLTNGTSMMHDLVVRERRLVNGADEPVAAAQMLKVPLLTVLAGRDTVTPPAITTEVAKFAPAGWEGWKIPDAGHDDAIRAPGYFDRLARWFKEQTWPPPGGPGAK